MTSTRAGEVTLNGRVLRVAEGFEVELAAAPPLLERPISIARDDQGRLYVTDSAGMSDKADKQLATKPHRIRRLAGEDAHGRYQQSELFATKVMFPEGALWHDDAVYVAAPPEIWKFPTSAAAGDDRSVWFNGKTLTGCGNDLHGPYLGRDGWFYWCKGAFAEQKHSLAGGQTLTTRASHIFRSRPDGSRLESVLTGGMDNPVGVAFLSTGERILSCTFFQHPKAGRRDGLIHAIYGGVYGKEHEVLAGHARTGELMPVLVHEGAAAPCGIIAGSEQLFGGGFRDQVFACYFNSHKVMRHVLVKSGATFRTTDTELISCDHPDFHPTDVLEDADGSLLVVDTGGWYKVCCPTSQLAKPDVLGAIYRVRKKGAPRVVDPLGLALNWKDATPDVLIERLGDRRLFVVRRATAELRRLGETAVPALIAVVSLDAAASNRQQAVWVLAGIEGPFARAAVRLALGDRAREVKLVAIQTAGLWRDIAAETALVANLNHDDPALVRAAAEAQGRLRDGRFVAPLLAAAARQSEATVDSSGAPADPALRVLEHSIIYALIEIGDRAATARGLESPSLSARRAALVALDQMPGGELTPAIVVPLLADRSPMLRNTATWIVGHHPEWGAQLVEECRKKLASATEPPDAAATLLLARLARAGEIQQVMAEALARNQPHAARVQALAAMREAHLAQAPQTWLSALAEALAKADASEVPALVSTARSLTLPKEGHAAMQRALAAIGRRADLPRAVKLEALAAAGSLAEPEPAVFEMLLAALRADEPFTERALAASLLGAAKLTPFQLRQLVTALNGVSPLELPKLLPAFERHPTAALGQELVAALQTAPSAKGLRAEQLRTVLAKFPLEVREAAQPLLESLTAAFAAQTAEFERLLSELPTGDARRGHEVFLSQKASCLSCHTLGYLGGRLGPDLTNLGKTRTPRDLAEAIAFPNASLTRGYETVAVVLADGRSLAGIIKSEGAVEIALALDPEKTMTVPRSEIEEIHPSSVSLMPQGFATVLSRQELADLLAFLLSPQR